MMFAGFGAVIFVMLFLFFILFYFGMILGLCFGIALIGYAIFKWLMQRNQAVG